MNSPNSTNMKEAIIEALRNHPEGLTLRDIAQIVGKHRHTITKYVYELIGAQVIFQRDVGAAKLCYLKESYNGEMGDDHGKIPMKVGKGQAQLLALFMILLLVPATVIVAQNATNSSIGLEGMATALNVTKEIPENLTIREGTEWVDGPALGGGEENTSAPANGTQEETNVTVPDEEPQPVNETNETAPEPVFPRINETVNETNETIPNETAPVENVTDINETQNITEDEVPIPDENVTEETVGPELSVDIMSPDRITRGETFELLAVVENTGEGEAGGVQIEWLLPDVFAVLDGDLTYECGNIAPNQSCTADLSVSAKYDANLGMNEIKVRVTYVEQ